MNCKNSAVLDRVMGTFSTVLEESFDDVVRLNGGTPGEVSLVLVAYCESCDCRHSLSVNVQDKLRAAEVLRATSTTIRIQPKTGTEN